MPCSNLCIASQTVLNLIFFLNVFSKADPLKNIVFSQSNCIKKIKSLYTFFSFLFKIFLHYLAANDVTRLSKKSIKILLLKCVNYLFRLIMIMMIIVI